MSLNATPPPTHAHKEMDNQHDDNISSNIYRFLYIYNMLITWFIQTRTRIQTKLNIRNLQDAKNAKEKNRKLAGGAKIQLKQPKTMILNYA